MSNTSRQVAIIKEIKDAYGTFLNVEQVTKLFHCDRKTVHINTDGLPYLREGREKKFLASDIGRRIAERMQNYR